MDKNNTRPSIKKNKKIYEGGGYKGTGFIRPLHPGLTLDSSRYNLHGRGDGLYPRYPENLYNYPSSILGRPANQQQQQVSITTRINIEMDVDTLDDLIHLGKKVGTEFKLEPYIEYNIDLAMIQDLLP